MFIVDGLWTKSHLRQKDILENILVFNHNHNTRVAIGNLVKKEEKTGTDIEWLQFAWKPRQSCKERGKDRHRY